MHSQMMVKLLKVNGDNSCPLAILFIVIYNGTIIDLHYPQLILDINLKITLLLVLASYHGNTKLYFLTTK